MKFFLPFLFLFAFSGCESVQYTDDDGRPVKRIVLSDKAEAVVQTTKDVAEGAGPFLPSPFNQIAMLVAGLAGGLLHMRGKLASYNKAKEIATTITVPRSSIPNLNNQPVL